MSTSAPTLIKFDERLYFTTFPSPLPSASHLNKSPTTRKLPTPSAAGGRGGSAQTSSPPPSSGDDESDGPSAEMLSKGKGKEKEKEGRDLHWLCIDNELIYQSFAKDFGPLNIAMVYKFCIHIHDLLQKEGSDAAIVLYASSDPQKKANAALLMALYVLIVQRKTPAEAFYPIADIEFVPFRDAGRGRGDFNLSIQDCLYGIWKALKAGLLNLEDFDIDEYCFYERVENGDFNWVSKDFIAFASPQDNHYVRALTNPKATSNFPNKKHTQAYDNVLNYFAENKVKLVVRLNNPLYDQRDFQTRGIEFKDMFFEDGTNPPPEMVREFLCDAQRIISANGVIAIHCKAGLGRTGCLIAAWLIYKHSFTAQEAIGFMRICRPGMVVGPQQQYILLNHLEWVKWAAADEAVAAYKASLALVSSPSRAITPPSDDRYGRNIPSTLPQVTPARHVASSNAAAARAEAPGQPRKTPLAKRTAASSIDEDDVDPDPLGRAPPHKYQRAKSDDSDTLLSPGRTASSSTAPAPAPPIASPAKSRKPVASRIAVSTRRGPATESKAVSRTLKMGNYNGPASPIAGGGVSRLPTLKMPLSRPFGLPIAARSPASGSSAVLTRGEVTRMTLVKEKTAARTLRKRRSSLSQTDFVR
ncbi:protein-tyrosine phosphatase-like protein [Mrakia frigida]|uniref:phosphoprotein phosphatase CDC14 n=1 Tax=Mrakia frigida TaxID=29902 RepID=UPI003FCBF0AD